MKMFKTKRLFPATACALLIALLSLLQPASVLAFNANSIDESFEQLAHNVPGFESWVDAKYFNTALLKENDEKYYNLFKVETPEGESCGYFICDENG